jgi:hypothetical protein
MFPEKYSDCDAPMFFLENDSISTRYKIIDSLAISIFSNLNPKFADKIRGQIICQIFVDSEGNSCCISSMNESNKSSSKIGLKDAINDLGKWSIPKRKGKAENMCAIVRMTFFDDSYMLERLGFNAKTRFTTLEKVSIKK